MRDLRIDVPGTPRPQGSLRAFKNGGMAYSNAAVLEPWRMSITSYAREAMASCEWNPCWPMTEPVRVDVLFLVERPAGHYGTGRNAGVLKPNAPSYPSTKPDVDKLARAILDGLTDAGVWRDDSQVVTLHARKRYQRYGDVPGVAIIVRPE